VPHAHISNLICLCALLLYPDSLGLLSSTVTAEYPCYCSESHYVYCWDVPGSTIVSTLLLSTQLYCSLFHVSYCLLLHTALNQTSIYCSTILPVFAK